jgi:hypothetical protein
MSACHSSFTIKTQEKPPKSLPELIDELVIWSAHDVLWVSFIVRGGAGLLVKRELEPESIAGRFHKFNNTKYKNTNDQLCHVGDEGIWQNSAGVSKSKFRLRWVYVSPAGSRI